MLGPGYMIVLKVNISNIYPDVRQNPGSIFDDGIVSPFFFVASPLRCDSVYFFFDASPLLVLCGDSAYLCFDASPLLCDSVYFFFDASPLLVLCGDSASSCFDASPLLFGDFPLILLAKGYLRCFFLITPNNPGWLGPDP